MEKPMKKLLLTSILTTSLALTACVNPITETRKTLTMSQDQYQAQIRVETDDFENSVKYVGYPLEYIKAQYDPEGVMLPSNASPLTLGDKVTYALRSFKHKTKALQDHQLYATIMYADDWRFYNRASDQDARTLKFDSISRDTFDCSEYGCNHIEDVAITLPKGYLSSKQKKGFKVKIAGKRGKPMIIAVPPAYIKAQLAVFNSQH